jgi:hypothetical protein
MKKLFLSLLVAFLSVTSLNAEGMTVCENGECLVALVQQSDGWMMSVNCGDGPVNYSGEGEYNGTICNGVDPE